MNPYNSPRVINALIEEIIERAQAELLAGTLSPSFVQNLQAAVDHMVMQVQIKGIRLTNLISIDVEADPFIPSNVNFRLRPLCEDGRFLLTRIESYRTEKPERSEAPPLAYGGPKVTRIVEV